MSDYIDDIPGAGFVIDHVFPGNDDTKQIEEMLNEIKQELDDMRAEMNEAWREITDQATMDFCASQLIDKESVIYDSWYDFKNFMWAVNNEKTEDEVNVFRNKFVARCGDTACEDATRFLLNGLDPQDSAPSTQCDDLDFMYHHSGKIDYVGWRDYVASKAGFMLLEAGIGMIMETISIIE